MQLTAGLTSSESDISDSNEGTELISTTSSLPLMVFPLYSTLSPEEQAKVRDVNYTMKNETFLQSKICSYIKLHLVCVCVCVCAFDFLL